jgi:WD40 repeat protein
VWRTQIAVGTKSGEILIYDLASASLVDTVKAHAGTLWSIHIRPDRRDLVTGGADKDVKFWDIEEKRVNEDDVCRCPIDRTGASEADSELVQILNNLIPSPHENTQNYRRCAVGPLQSEWQTPRRLPSRFYRKGFLSGLLKIFPFPLWTQSMSTVFFGSVTR